MDDERTILCRCEEITVGEVLQAIEQGARDIDAVKRMTRAGMGLCQGRTCSVLVRYLLKWKLGLADRELPAATTRPPVRPIPSRAFLEALERLDRAGTEAADVPPDGVQAAAGTPPVSLPEAETPGP